MEYKKMFLIVMMVTIVVIIAYFMFNPAAWKDLEVLLIEARNKGWFYVR